MGGVSGARWQSEDQLHLTLRFIGEVDRHQAADIDAALGVILHPPFEIALAGIGSFEHRGEPAALWAGVAPHEPLKTLHKKIDQAIVRTGLEPEGRAYLPHVTLARLPRGGGPVGHFLAAAGRASPARLSGRRISASTRASSPPTAPLYTIVERYRLG